MGGNFIHFGIESVLISGWDEIVEVGVSYYCIEQKQNTQQNNKKRKHQKSKPKKKKQPKIPKHIKKRP